MRVLIGINASDLSVDLESPHLKKLKTNLRKKNIDHRFTQRSDLFIPLYFIGDVGRDTLVEIDSILSEIIQRHSIFDLGLEGIWAYPNQEEGRLLWIGVQNSKELRALQGEISSDIEELTEEASEHTYRPHLPIARLKNHRHLKDIISPFKNTDFGLLRVERVSIYEMLSGGAYPTFKILKEYKLGAASETFENAYP